MKRLFYIIFLLLISFPLLDQLINILPKNVDSEKRGLTVKDEGAENVVMIFKNYLETFDENFHGRSLLINQFLQLKKDVLHDSPLPNKLLLGKDGFLFLVDYNSMDDYRNINHFNYSEKERILEEFKKNQKFCSDNGILYVITIIPEKQTIYPEFLPDKITKVQKKSRLEDFITFCESKKADLPVIYLKEKLLKNKDKYPHKLFFKEESHWNYLGGMVAFDTLKGYLKTKYNFIVPSVDYKLKAFNENDLDLAMQLGKAKTYSEKTTKPFPDKLQEILDEPHPLHISEKILKRKPNYFISKSNLAQSGKVMIYRDSYSRLWQDYFFNSFEHSLLIWTYNIDLEDVKKYNPDLLIHEIAERHLDFILNE